MKRLRKLVAAAAGITFVVAACGGGSGGGTDNSSGGSTDGTTASSGGGTDSTPSDGSSGGDGSHSMGGTLTLGAIASPASLAANEAQYGRQANYFQAIYDGLLRTDPDGTIVPWLATEWSYNDDNTVLTLTLRDDVMFSDGTPFNADAAVQNIERFRDGNAPNAGFFSGISAVTAVDDTTLEITLKEPDPAMLNFLARDGALMQAPSSFGAADEAANPIGSGAYIVDTDRTVAESVYYFKKNPDYWAPESAHYDELVIKVLADATAMANAMQAGEVNAGDLVSNDVRSQVEGGGFTIQNQELDWVGLTLVDRDGALGSPLSDVKVRQAMNYAIDGQAILDGFNQGFGTVTEQIFNKDGGGFDPALDSTYGYDVEKAKSLLAEAGYPDGFEIEMPTSAVIGEAIYAIIADQLGAVGIKVTNTPVERADFFSSLLAPKFPAFLMFLEEPLNEWQAIKFNIGPDATWNPAGYTDDESKALIDQIQVASDEDRPALVKQLNKYLVDQAWFVPFYRNQAAYATDGDTAAVMQAGNIIPYLWNITPAS